MPDTFDLSALLAKYPDVMKALGSPGDLNPAAVTLAFKQNNPGFKHLVAEGLFNGDRTTGQFPTGAPDAVSAAKPLAAPSELAAPVATTTPGVLSKLASALPWLSAATGVTDLAQTLEPNRHDIGMAGIGKTQHVPGEHPALLNALLIKLMQERASR